MFLDVQFVDQQFSFEAAILKYSWTDISIL